MADQTGDDRRRAVRFALFAAALVGAFVVIIVATTAGRGDDDDLVAGPSSSTTRVVGADATTPAPTAVAPSEGEENDDTDGEDGAPATTAPIATTTTAVAGPRVESIGAPATFSCSEAPVFVGPGMLMLSWTTSGAESVTVAIDNPDGPYQTGLPTNGSLEVPAPCAPDDSTYYVIAIAPDGSTATGSAFTQGI
ncbi:MAG: hypothetical protein ACT4OX_13960 [Actinomycetota bacterium]